MKLDGLDFREAVQKLLDFDRPGPTWQRADRAEAGTGSCRRRTRNALLERVIAVYEKTFAEVAGRPDAYLERRGITDAGLFSRHRVGYANGKLKDLLPSGGAVRDELKAIGVLLDNGHERFAGCVIFPVYDPDGHLVTIYGRYTQDGLEAPRLSCPTVRRDSGTRRR